MIGVQLLIDIVALTLETAFVYDRVDGYRPASLLLIAKPESGKTSAIETFRDLKYVKYLNEVTVKTLVNQVFPLIEKREVRFILIPDILNCVEKKTYTRQPLLNTFKSLVDEGVTEILTPYKIYKFSGNIKAGLISAITRSGFYKGQHRYSLFEDLKRMGFLSRMIPFSYKYPIDLFIKIFRYIEGSEIPRNETVIIPKIITRKNPVKFEPDPELFPDLRVISMRLGAISDAYGIRVQKNLQKMCYANSLMNGRKYVTREDINKILELSRWMNFDFNLL